jgi:hypothetical protein
MASLQTRLSDLITAVGTDIKQLRTWITGSSSGDLTGLATTDKTCLVNAINEVRAGAVAPSAASEIVSGIAELATQAETNAGTDDARIVTPLKFQTRLAAYALPLSYLDTDGTLAANSDTKVASQKAAKTYIDGIIAAANAAVYKGVIDASANPNYPAADAGWTYRISVAGKIGGASGPNVEVGDLLLCLTDGTAAGNHATVGANWDIIQTNIDGAVVGPSSATSADLATFNGTTGKIIQDSGVAVSTDGTLATNNNTKVPTEGAIRTYLAATYYTQTQLGNPDTDLAALYTTAKT